MAKARKYIHTPAQRHEVNRYEFGKWKAKILKLEARVRTLHALLRQMTKRR